jgi:ABC-2 type transport system permease protein
VNAALLRDGAAEPSGFWVRYAADRAWSRLKVFGIVVLVPLAIFGGLYWKAELGDRATAGALLGRIAGTVAGGALLHLLLGALLDLVCETSRFGALLQRETMFYFHTPVPYMVMVLFTLASGYFFVAILFGDPSGRVMVTYRHVFQYVASFLIFLVPILTIRSFAEEKASGTVEPLLTAPVTEAQVVAGKFCGAMIFYVVMLLPTLAYFAVLRYIGASVGKPDAGPVVAGYAGMVLFGGFHIAIGIFASTLTQDSVLGAFLAFVMTLLFWVIQPLMQARRLLQTPGWEEAGDYLSPTEHLGPFLKGTIPPLDVIYFASFTLFFLFLAVRSIEYRKWR